MARPIDFHYWPTPNGWKVAIFLEEAGIPYNLKPVNIGAGDQFKPEFLAISPNNRMPAIVDPDGPGGTPISVFESGAILQYLARKTGQFYPSDERVRVAVDEWLFWQVGGLGPMAGQAHHFRFYAKEPMPYSIDRYTDETNRLYGVMERRLAQTSWLGGDDYTIADMACLPWIARHERQGQKLEDTPALHRWYDKLRARPAVERALELEADAATDIAKDTAAQTVLFGQTAR